MIIGERYFNPHMDEMSFWGCFHFSQTVLLENCQKAQIPCVALFLARKYIS